MYELVENKQNASFPHIEVVAPEPRTINLDSEEETPSCVAFDPAEFLLFYVEKIHLRKSPIRPL